MLKINPQEFLYTFIDNHSIELISVIGSGSYGVVYLGRYVYTADKYYAVKCLLNNPITRNEIEVHSTLSGHPNILPLEKVIEERNHIFIIMEYATHGDLFSNITQSESIIGKTKVTRHLFLQLLDAVQYCHTNMIAHRDLKPENILLFPNHRVKLADFGLATSQLYSKEFCCGSSFYFSPECQGTTPTQQVNYYDTFANDIWSLGVILINLVSGRNPWKQANMQDPAFAAYVKHPHRFFRTILPNISKSLERVLARMFCLNPSKRITLPELKSMILGCKSFFFSMPCKNTHELEYTDSLASTMLAYVGDYIDESSSDSSLSSCWSHQQPSSMTPRNTSSNFYICKLQQKQYELDYIRNYD